MSNFVNYEKQIFHLKNEKELIIKDDDYATKILKDYSHFSIINAYKELFYNKAARKYNRNVTFENFVSFYNFDSQLREIFFKEFLFIEQKLKSSISYYFCEYYDSDEQNIYLDKNSYNNSPLLENMTLEVVGTLNSNINNETKYQYINYYKENHHNVPLWVGIKSLMFGHVSKMYSCLLPAIQTSVVKDFCELSENDFNMIIKVITDFRNVCAHNERFYCDKSIRSSIPDTIYHEKLNIIKVNQSYKYGKQDLFAVVIALKIILDNNRFLIFANKLEFEINKIINETPLNKDVLLNKMGFPINWKDIIDLESIKR